MVTAWQGRESEARALAELCKREATARGQGTFVNVADLALAVLENGLGRYDAAFNSATAALAHRALWSRNRALPELVEAATRLRRHDTAKKAVEQLEESTRASGTSWALGVLARCQALTASSGEDEELYREAIGHLERCRVTPDLARARLLYGEWLRRRRRRRDARDELRGALEMFTSMGAAAFAERARRELLATGERSRKRIPGTEATLTPRELRIAGLAVDGDSNAEIAARLFISPRTVEYHLHKVFRKLGLSSRRELTHSLLERETPPTDD
jgi:DNA-binding CsgD family transcriptional regulator